MTKRFPPALSELLCPQQLDDLALPQSDIEHLKRMVTQSAIVNMLFHGGSGTGKTSAARMALKAISANNGVEFAGSATWKCDIVEQIENYASSQSLFGEKKCCLIDEADLLPKPMQNALRHIIDNTSKRTVYLFTANDISKISVAVQSRLLPLSFDVVSSDCPEVRQRILVRAKGVLSNANIPYDDVSLEKIIDERFPDLRAVANALQWEFGATLPLNSRTRRSQTVSCKKRPAFSTGHVRALGTGRNRVLTRRRRFSNQPAPIKKTMIVSVNG
jgi:replication-associated recombination protein RarA